MTGKRLWSVVGRRQRVMTRRSGGRAAYASAAENRRGDVTTYLSKILNATVYDVCEETPLHRASGLSDELKNEVYFKREDMQPVFSFKLRGAYNKIKNLVDANACPQGVVACSAGNHAQGVAYSAKRLGIRATIIMPLGTPKIKVDSVKTHGGPNVVVRLFGSNFDEAAAESKRLVKEEGMTMIHPFDDPDVIAGQGTIGMEICKATAGRKLDAIFVCCGGGGMLAGIAAYVKSVRPEVLVIGVEAEDAAGMTASLSHGNVVTLDHVGLFADGAAVKTVGSETFRVCHGSVDEMVNVTTDEICQAIKTCFNETRTTMEPAGVLAVAGARKWLQSMDVTDKTVVAITSGANVDFDRLRFISERADASEALLAIEIPETPGAFYDLYKLIFPRNVTEFSYRYASGQAAQIIVSFQGQSDDDVDDVVRSLNEKGYHTLDFADNELGKSHVRYLAGGRSPDVGNERLFRFEFPEQPGALSRFLDSLNRGFNCSLFHYRNHGDDFGRVLVGIQPEVCGNGNGSGSGDATEFQTFLDDLGYAYVEETTNPARSRFLL